MTLGWWVVVLMVCAILVYGAYIWLCARDEVRVAPRVDMFTCDKHGVYPAKWALRSNLLPLGEAGEDYKVCPMCLEDAERQAKARFGL